jgi:hypothetical protein
MDVDKEKVSHLLNKILEMELAGAVRYTHYSLMVYGYNRIPIVSWLRAQANESLMHAQSAGEMITSLGDHPSLGIGPLLETHKHDIGDILLPANHAELGALLLKPYVSEANYWMMEKHGIFQGYYFFHHLGLDRDMREQFRGHPHFEYCAQFCHLYDQNSFDPDYESMPLEAFEPMLRRVVETPRQSLYKRD